VDKLGACVRSGVSRLRGVDLSDGLELEILSELIEGGRTQAELVEKIYGVGRGDDGFLSCYTRVRRAVKRLESKGLVATRVFGREKPYRLTDLAVTNLARIGREEKQLPIVPKIDAFAYTSMLGTSLLIIALAMGWYELSELDTLCLFGSFCFFLGLSVYGFLRGIMRVL
jgi:hypothetical protein